MFADRYIDFPVERQNRNITLCTGRFIDVTHIGAEILDDLEVGRGSQFSFANGKILMKTSRIAGRIIIIITIDPKTGISTGDLIPKLAEDGIKVVARIALLVS